MALFIVVISLWISCNSVFGTICDDSYECQSNTITDAALCNGFLGCYQATIDGSYVECNGFYGCYQATSISASIYVHCNGAYSCYNSAQIKAITYIQCNGHYSCAFTIMQSLTNTNCTAQSSCYASTISAGAHILCDGKNACAHTQLISTKNTYCIGESACTNSIINAQDYVYVYGHYGAQSSTISARKVFAYGADALRDTDLDSADIEDMDVYSYGYQAGFDAQFVCRSGSVCNLYCSGNGCNGMEFICLYGASCSISPVECTSGGVLDGIYCPIKRVSVSMEDDAKVMQFINVKQEDKETDTQMVRLEQDALKEMYRDNMGFYRKLNLDASNIMMVLLSGLLSSLVTAVMAYCYFERKYKHDYYASLV